MSIFLIRHGETASNAARIVQVPETPLSERGLDQASRLATRVAELGVSHILSSDLARAHMTAERIALATGVNIQLDPDLQERNFGAHRGISYADLGVDLFAPDHAPPDGETWAVFHQRVDRAWKTVRELAPRVEGNLAVVTHGLVCHSVATRHLDISGTHAAGAHPDGPMIRFGNTALTELRGPEPWRIERFACTAHLDDVSSRGGPA